MPTALLLQPTKPQLGKPDGVHKYRRDCFAVTPRAWLLRRDIPRLLPTRGGGTAVFIEAAVVFGEVGDPEPADDSTVGVVVLWSLV